MRTFTEVDERIAPPAAAIIDRAGRWATVQVGRHGRTVAEVAHDLGCDWHTVMDTVNFHGAPLIDDPDRIGVFGGSFGGFATLSWVSRLSDLFSVRVSIVGPSTPVTLTRSVPPTWRVLMKIVGRRPRRARRLVDVALADQLRRPASPR